MHFTVNDKIAMEVLLKIAGWMEKLQNGDLAQAIKDAHGLTEAETAKAAEARDTIAQADTFLAEIKKQKDELAVIDQRLADAKAAETRNAQAQAQLDRQAGELAAKEKSLTFTARDQAQKQATLDGQAAKTEAAAQANAKERKELDAYRAELKAEAQSLDGRAKELSAYDETLKQSAQEFKRFAVKL